jgi:multiple sugar transport system permease protein
MRAIRAGRQSANMERPRRREKWDKIALLFILPYLLFLALFTVYPMFMAVAGSLAEWDILASTLTWVGFENYIRLFQDPEFYLAIRNSLIYLFVQVPLSIVGGIFLALLLNGHIQFRNFYRGIYFLPVITGGVVLSIIWKWMYSESSGVLNYFLSFINVPPVPWLTSSSMAMISISLMKVWTDVGFYAVIFLAALQSIPKELLEAATSDGASRWRLLWNIKLPLLNPAIIFSIIMGTIWAMQIFTEVLVMTGGGPLGSSTTLTFFLYRQGFTFSDMGYASAVGVTTAALILLISLLERKLFERDIN